MSRINVATRDQADFLCERLAAVIVFHANTDRARQSLDETRGSGVASFPVPNSQCRAVAEKMSQEGWTFADHPRPAAA